MIKDKSKNEIQNVCDFKYLIEVTSDRKDLMVEIMDTFLTQAPNDLNNINNAVVEKNYGAIHNLAHGLKSSVFVMGISVLVPVLQEMEDLGMAAENIEKINALNKELNSICQKSMKEIEMEKLNYSTV